MTISILTKRIQHGAILLLWVASVCCLFSVEDPESDEKVIRGYFEEKKYEVVDAGLDKFLQNTEISDDDRGYLATVQRLSLSYSPRITIRDFEISLRAAQILLNDGSASLAYLGVMLNYVAQDNAVLYQIPAKEYAEYRKKTSEIVVAIYKLAVAKSVLPHDFNKTLTTNPAFPEELIQGMSDRKVKYDDVGRPIFTADTADLRKLYDDAISTYIKTLSDRKAHLAAAKILEPRNRIIIENYFTQRYSRIPVDYLECRQYLDQTPVDAAFKKEIYKKISVLTQTNPPKELGSDSGISTGDPGF